MRGVEVSDFVKTSSNSRLRTMFVFTVMHRGSIMSLAVRLFKQYTTLLSHIKAWLLNAATVDLQKRAH